MASARFIVSRRVVLPTGIAPAAVRIEAGRIAAVLAPDAVPAEAAAGGDVLDVGDAVLMPGVVDTHVHLNEPGRTEWEGFETATRAAAAGGITTVCDMPLNSIPVTTTAAALRTKVDAVSTHAWVDWALWGGVVPGNAPDLEALLAAGALGAKCFLVHSGIDEFPDVTEADLDLAMPILARHGAVLLVHAEVPGPIAAAEPAAATARPDEYRRWLASRPPACEDDAVAMMIRLAERHHCRTHIVHLSSASALPLLAAARARGVPITVETCGHYLTFASEDIADGQTHFKCAPPIRERANREALWQGLRAGTIDLVVSDHSPCTPALKALESGDFHAAWGGISGLQLALSVVWTGAAAHGFDLSQLTEWMCAAPARLAGLGGRKGSITVGADADLVVFHPERTQRVDPAHIHHRHRLTPYAGCDLRGVVGMTFLRGERVFHDGQFPAAPLGQRLLPQHS